MNDHADLQRPRLSLKKRILMLLIMIGFTLGCAELILRVFAREVVLRHRMSEGGLYTPFTPGGVGDHAAPEFRVRYHINSLGFRDRERTPAKRSDEFRTLCLGDSFSVGWGVAQNKTYVSLTEQRLQNQQGPKLTIWNMARSGFNPLFYLEQARYFSKHYNPDAFIVQIFDNDPIEIQNMRKRFIWGSELQYVGVKPRYLDESYGPFNVKYQLNHLAVRRAVRKLKDLAKGTGFKHFLAPGVDSQLTEADIQESDLIPLINAEVEGFNRNMGWYFDQFASAWDQTFQLEERILKQLADECKQRKQQLVFVYIPHSVNFAKSSKAKALRAKNRHRELVNTVSRERSVVCVDMTNVLEKTENPLSYYFKGDLHFNENGHKLVADTLIQRRIIQRFASER